MLLNKSKSNSDELLSPALATNHVVSLPEVLASRELRQSRQLDWLATHRSSLISLTLVAPGPIKDSSLTREIFNLAWQQLHLLFAQQQWPILAEEVFIQPTGTEALIAINLPAQRIKNAVVDLEQTSKVGRLWDIDVLDSTGNILSRQDNGHPPRSCLICANDARICGRNRTHSIDQLLAAMEKLLHEQ